MPKLRWLLVLLMMLGMGWLGWHFSTQHNLQNQPIRYVRIEGAFQYTHKDKLKEIVGPELKMGFYQADMAKIQNAISQMPLVEKVDVRRVWPDAVHITIKEQKPVVRWGKNALLNNQGDVLFPESIEAFSNLPMISGPDGQEKKLLEIMKGVYIVLKDKSMQLAEFHVNERRAWRIKLANGLEMQLGNKEPLASMQRFLKTLDLLGKERLELMASVDTRYPNGYAVTWKPGIAPIDWRAVAAELNENKAVNTGLDNTNKQI